MSVSSFIHELRGEASAAAWPAPTQQVAPAIRSTPAVHQPTSPATSLPVAQPVAQPVALPAASSAPSIRRAGCGRTATPPHARRAGPAGRARRPPAGRGRRRVPRLLVGPPRHQRAQRRRRRPDRRGAGGRDARPPGADGGDGRGGRRLRRRAGGARRGRRPCLRSGRGAGGRAGVHRRGGRGLCRGACRGRFSRTSQGSRLRGRPGGADRACGGGLLARRGGVDSERCSGARRPRASRWGSHLDRSAAAPTTRPGRRVGHARRPRVRPGDHNRCGSIGFGGGGPARAQARSCWSPPPCSRP